MMVMMVPARDDINDTEVVQAGSVEASRVCCQARAKPLENSAFAGRTEVRQWLVDRAEY